MTYRIKQADLDGLCKRINELTGSPAATYTKDENGQYRANIGNYYLSWAYGGVKLERMVNPCGGCSEISRNGYSTKRQLFDFMLAFINGLESK